MVDRIKLTGSYTERKTALTQLPVRGGRCPTCNESTLVSTLRKDGALICVQCGQIHQPDGTLNCRECGQIPGKP